MIHEVSGDIRVRRTSVGTWPGIRSYGPQLFTVNDIEGIWLKPSNDLFPDG